MRSAETVLGVIQQRGKQGLPLEDIYRQFYNSELYLRSYARLYSNDGAMTPGANEETVDGMSVAKIEQLIEQLRYERHRWAAVKRIYIPKQNGKLRPLGLPSWSDKLLGDVIRQILEAYYDPQFSDRSHGFRPGRGCHTALREVLDTWKGTHWFIEGDISQCFASLNHEVLLSILKEKLHDNRFLRLIQNMLEAGYLENWKWQATLSGCPQGSVVSPVLSNVYLDRLDKFVEQTLLPKYNRGKSRRANPAYTAFERKIERARAKKDHKLVHQLKKQRRELSSQDPDDANYRRLRYIRYCDDFLLGFSGPKTEAEEIKQAIRDFLHEVLKLELSEEKTLITHAQTQPAHFLGYEIVTQQVNDKLDWRGWRGTNGTIGLRLPAEVVEKKCALYQRKAKPAQRAEMHHDSDYAILNKYQSEYRGLVQYYLLATNVGWLNKLHWVMQTSLLKTLAGKYKSSVTKMAKKYKTTIVTQRGVRKCLQVIVKRGAGKKPLIAQFGGMPLIRQKEVVIVDKNPRLFRTDRSELLKRLLADKCELCGTETQIEVHHIRKLADLKQKGVKEKPKWVQLMAAKLRKTLVVCRNCHNAIHSGKVKTVKLE